MLYRNYHANRWGLLGGVALVLGGSPAWAQRGGEPGGDDGSVLVIGTREKLSLIHI